MLEYSKFQLDIRILRDFRGGLRFYLIFLFSMRMGKHRIHRDTVESTSLEVFKTQLGRSLSNLVCLVQL